MAGEAPGTEREKDRQHHRELLGQEGDGERDAGQRALDPVAAQQAVSDHHEGAECERHHAELGDEAGRVLLQERRLGLDRGERDADAAESCRRPSSHNACHALPAHNERAREQVRRVLASGLSVDVRLG